MLNQKLLDALEELFGSLGPASNEGKIGEYTLPKKTSVCFSSKQREFAQVINWGESYRVNCPVCGDTRHRLYFSHMYGTKLYPKGRKTPIFFSKSLVHCFNEGCHRREGFKEYRDQLDTFISKDIVIIGADENPKLKAYTSFLSTETSLPKPNFSIVSDDLPGCAYTFLEQRQLDAPELDKFYLCRFVPQGATWEDENNKMVFQEDRLLIPIMQRRKLVSWQARRIMETDSKYKKYVFEPHSQASHYLYNMDRAWRFKNVIICEGVTDVWRIGEDEKKSVGAVALLGKNMTKEQMDIIKVLWGYDGKGVVMLDPDASKENSTIYRFLKAYNVFPRGVELIQLKDKDPADHTREELMGLIDAAISD